MMTVNEATDVFDEHTTVKLNVTRSQAVARIADRTAFVGLLVILHTKPCTKFEVSSSSSFGDMFDHVPKILGVT